MRRVVFVCIVTLALLSASLAQAAAPVPFKPGATWVYAVHKRPYQGTPAVETLTVVYKGEMKFHGRAVHAFDSAGRRPRPRSGT